MQAKNPKVSVIIPTYNRANYIVETIDSVLAQTYEDFEIIVIDDGSTDNTEDTINKYNGKIRYFYQENKGTAAARNFGISKARGEYIAFLDDDDLWLSEKLERQTAILDADKQIGFVCSAGYKIDEHNNNKISSWQRNGNANRTTFESLYERNFVYNLTVLIRKRCIEEVGGLDETLIVSQDYDLWLRVAKKHRFHYINQPLALWRIHKSNLSKNLDIRLHDHFVILNKKEIKQNISSIKQRICIARLYYEFADEYIRKGDFYKIGICYLKAIVSFPFIGYYYWPKEVENIKFSFLYRILKVYFLAIGYLLKYLFYSEQQKKNIFFKILNILSARLFLFMSYIYSLKNKLYKISDYVNFGFISEEFFHQDLRGFGGFGKTVKDISEYFNSNCGSFKSSVLIPQGLSVASSIAIKRFHNTDVLIRPIESYFSRKNHYKYMHLINSFGLNLFITIEYYPTYEYVLLAAPTTPVLIWIRDPRSEIEWRKIATVPLELAMSGRKRKDDLIRFAEEKKNSILKMLKLSRILKRKIVFATQGHCLIERAKRTYGLDSLNPHLLYNPIPLIKDRTIKYSEKPSLCFIGRLDPVKRPWIVFELAKRFPQIDFYIVGKTHAPELMKPIINKYAHIQNLKFMGLLFDKEKNDLLKNCWGIINTSIHEAIPVSFLEAFSFGKCIISCQNPDDLVKKFGFFTGEILGEGLDKYSLERFSENIENLITNRKRSMEKGKLAQTYVEENHSFSKFERQLQKILSLEKIIQ
ncbi:MAG: glycosyltransferase [Candidatus Omnitrophota bacterium]